MNRIRSAIPFAVAAALALAPLPAAAQVGSRQWYDPTWQWSPNHTYLYTTYHFRSEPGGPEKTHLVVWDRNSTRYRNYFYYLNRDSGLIWCRAAAFNRGSKIWKVLDDDEKRERIGDIADGVWDSHSQIRPTIPGSNDGTLMELPPLPPDV